MIIKTIDYQKVLDNFGPYKDGMDELSKIKDEYVEKLESKKGQMEQIVNAQSNLILDKSQQEEQQQELYKLQQEAIQIDAELKEKYNNRREELMQETHDKLKSKIEEFRNHCSKSVDHNGTDGQIDLIMTQDTVLFVSDSCDITGDLIEYING